MLHRPLLLVLEPQSMSPPPVLFCTSQLHLNPALSSAIGPSSSYRIGALFSSEPSSSRIASSEFRATSFNLSKDRGEGRMGRWPVEEVPRRTTVRLGASSGDEIKAKLEESVEGGESVQDEDIPFDISRLEAYTEKMKTEVLRVHAMVDDEEDEVMIFKGFSSSLMRPTAFDPAEPVLSSTAIIQKIDRIRGPFDPSKVRYIKGGRGLSWKQFQELLKDRGL